MIQNKIQLELTPTRSDDFTHAQFCRLLVSIVRWKQKHVFKGHVSFKRAFREAEKAVKRVDPTAITLTENRLNKIISNPPARLYADEVSLFTQAFDLSFREQVPDDAWDAIVGADDDSAGDQTRRETRKAEPEIPFEHLGLVSDILGLRGASQARLKDIAGEYILFRRVRGKRLLAAHFSIKAPSSNDKPATFSTLGAAGGAVHDQREVQGFIYRPQEGPEHFFSVGKVKGSSEIRVALLRPVDKPTRLDNPPDNFITDLIGIRLGLGRWDRTPLAYRIWCSRVIDKLPQSELRSYVREYTLDQAREFFTSDKIIGFDYILKWLNNPLFVVLNDDDDPVIE